MTKYLYYKYCMKVDISKYIQGCLQCILKQIIRVKTKNPMIITDTPTTTNTGKRESYFSKRIIKNIS